MDQLFFERPHDPLLRRLRVGIGIPLGVRVAREGLIGSRAGRGLSGTPQR